MFQKGEYVIYGNNGICCIEEIGIPVGTPMGHSGKEYYTLTPVFSSGKIYAPLDTKVFMRPILTKEQAERLIVRIPDIQAEEVMGQDAKALGEKYKGCLDTHRCEDLVRLIKTVYRKERNLEENGKKLAKTEREYGKLARELLHREFSMALEVPYEEVEDYITEKVAALQK
mgnify:CR=1 FL=1